MDRIGYAAGVLSLMMLGLCACSDDSKDMVADAGTDALVPVAFSHDNLIEACVRLGACDIERQVRVTDCLNNFYKVLSQNGKGELYKRMYTCVNKGAGDCAKIRECMGLHRRPTDPKKKCDNTYKDKCVGEVAYTCDLLKGFEYKIDCSKGGLKCAVKDTSGNGKGPFVAFCGGGKCDSKSAEWSKPKCVANRQYSCLGGGIEIVDCASQNLQCRDPTQGTCEGRGKSCKTSNKICVGNVLTDCKNNYLWEIDCTKLPGKKKCDSNSNTCMGVGTECKENSFFDQCDTANPNVLISCLDGYKKKFDCKQMGFEGCKQATAYGAYCRALPVYE